MKRERNPNLSIQNNYEEYNEPYWLWLLAISP